MNKATKRAKRRSSATQRRLNLLNSTKRPSVQAEPRRVSSPVYSSGSNHINCSKTIGEVRDDWRDADNASK